MKKLFVVLSTALILSAPPWPTSTADADPRGHGFRGSSGHRPGVGHHHRFPARHFAPFGTVIAPPFFAYSVPTVLAPPPAYYPPPPAYYAPPPAPSSAVYSSVVLGAPPGYSGGSYPPAPTAPPAPRVVEFPSGRYEMRGDGIAMPYTWVWIPNPPSAPPTAAPAALAGAPGSADALPPSRQQVYTWVDKQGVEHWTNRADKAPRP